MVAICLGLDHHIVGFEAEAEGALEAPKDHGLGQARRCLYTSHKKVFQMKTSACRDETLKNQPNKMGTTPQHIYTIPTSCAILPTMLCVC